MLTCTEEIFRDAFGFRIFGKGTMKTQVYRFLDKELSDKRFQIKLHGVLNAVNSDPLRYQHPEKFKHLENDVWEIKIKPFRIACIWDGKPNNLIAIYAFKKKADKWSKQDLENMRRQRDKYLTARSTRLEGDYYGRTKQIPE